MDNACCSSRVLKIYGCAPGRGAEGECASKQGLSAEAILTARPGSRAPLQLLGAAETRPPFGSLMDACPSRKRSFRPGAARRACAAAPAGFPLRPLTRGISKIVKRIESKKGSFNETYLPENCPRKRLFR
jgi:hypothetical protein